MLTWTISGVSKQKDTEEMAKSVKKLSLNMFTYILFHLGLSTSSLKICLSITLSVS